MHLYYGSEQLMLNPRNKVWEQCAPPCQHTCCWSHQIHDGWIGTLGVDCDLLSQRVFYHHWHPLSCGVKPQCVQKLKAQLAQVWKLHGHLIWQTTDKSTVIGPGSINQRCLVWWLCLKSELAFILSQSFCFIKAGWDGLKACCRSCSGRFSSFSFVSVLSAEGGGQHAAATLWEDERLVARLEELLLLEPEVRRLGVKRLMKSSMVFTGDFNS